MTDFREIPPRLIFPIRYDQRDNGSRTYGAHNLMVLFSAHFIDIPWAEDVNAIGGFFYVSTSAYQANEIPWVAVKMGVFILTVDLMEKYSDPRGSEKSPTAKMQDPSIFGPNFIDFEYLE